MNIAPFKNSLINSGKAIKSNTNISIIYEANIEAAVPIIITPIVLKFTKECKKIDNKITIKKSNRGGKIIAPKVIQIEESNIFFNSSFPDFKLMALLIPSNKNKLAITIFKDIILVPKAVVKNIKATIG